MIKTTILLDEDQYEFLRGYGFTKKISIGNVVREAIDKFRNKSNDTDNPKLIGRVESSNLSLSPEYNRCEVQGCKSYETEWTKGEGYDDEGNLREYAKWLCAYHRKLVK